MSEYVEQVEQNLPTIALVGRVNVGKSTLFNRITQTNHALVSNVAGTTRTRNVASALWRGKQFRIIDTGGLTFDTAVPLEADIIKQTEAAIKEADIILFVVDIKEGILPQEKELARFLLKRKTQKTIIFVANKTDSSSLRAQIHDQEILRLGMGAPLAVSAKNGVGVGDLLDFIYKKLNTKGVRPKKISSIRPIRVSIVGKPNVGKSSLFNKLIGEERVIVSDMPHTTREPHDMLVKAADEYILFVDTAGIRRKAKVSGALERAGISKSLESINRSDIVLFILDATEPISDQDKQLAGLLREHTKSVIIVINKWDMAEDNTDSFRNDVKSKIYKNFPHLDFAPIVFVSAKNNYRVHQIFPLIKQAWEGRRVQLTEDMAHEFIKAATRKHLPSRGKGVRHPEIVDFRQININPPIFEMFIKYRTSLNISYVHFLENRLREQFNFFAVPIVIKLTKMKRK